MFIGIGGKKGHIVGVGAVGIGVGMWSREVCKYLGA